jgi:hypothetical protein
VVAPARDGRGIGRKRSTHIHRRRDRARRYGPWRRPRSASHAIRG